MPEITGGPGQPGPVESPQPIIVPESRFTCTMQDFLCHTGSDKKPPRQTPHHSAVRQVGSWPGGTKLATASLIYFLMVEHLWILIAFFVEHPLVPNALHFERNSLQRSVCVCIFAVQIILHSFLATCLGPTVHDHHKTKWFNLYSVLHLIIIN